MDGRLSFSCHVADVKFIGRVVVARYHDSRLFGHLSSGMNDT